MHIKGAQDVCLDNSPVDNLLFFGFLSIDIYFRLVSFIPYDYHNITADKDVRKPIKYIFDWRSSDLKDQK